jgi:glucose-6-phosphate isomerase
VRAPQTSIFLRTPLENSIPVLMALMGVWYRNFWGYSAQAILPYAHTLEHFKSYIQQMDMESNGKGTRIDGHPTNVATGPILFGEVGTDAQHAFMQLLHQSAEIIPADLIVVARPEHTLRDHHIKLVSHALAQSKALMEGSPNPQKPHSHFEGNRPSSTFILDQLDAWHLGVLMALYEHKIFVQGVIWGINSFDQWGVELGKTIATSIINGFENDQFQRSLDPSSAGLLKILRQKFTNS